MNYKVIESKYSEFILNIKDYFSKEKNIVIYDKRNVIKVSEFNEQKYVLKSFKIPHIINKIVYKFFRDSKAKRSYENSVRLIELDINTPKPIGYIEFDTTFLFNESFYISEFFDYDFEIRAVFKDDNFENKVDILEKFVEFSYELHNKGVYHIDYSPGNILVKKIDDKYQFYIIDVNRMKFLDFDLDLRMKSMSKLTSVQKDNDFMAKYYSEISGINIDEIIEKFNFYLDEQRKYLENKKKLKVLKGK
ncbi:MAG: hypothetical protein DRG78_06030 [Epsilonproteobacteria bacterium]|nr:MAG: hypothetical protein DRG78_06030 [Campylobacterota bacterium]